MALGTVELLVAAVREKRADLRLSSESLSLMSGVDPEAIVDLENGLHVPGIKDVIRILEVLGIHATQLPSVPQPRTGRLADFDLIQHLEDYDRYGVQGRPTNVCTPYRSPRPEPGAHKPHHP